MPGEITREEEWAGLALAALLACLAILGAFLGAARARAMFNSPPVAMLWLTATGLLAARAVRWHSLRTSGGLAVACLGGLLVLAGGLYGSDMGRRLTERALHWSRVPAGYVVLAGGTTTNEIRDRSEMAHVGVLPFALRLEDVLPDSPAIRGGVPLQTRDSGVGHGQCKVSVIDGSREVKREVVAVNRPLRYGGYHFTLVGAGGGGASGRVVLLVKSDSGLAPVYAGFVLVLAGVTWACWVQPVVARLRKRDGD